MSMKADLELSVRLRPKNVRACYVCGPDNARGLQVAFLTDGARGSRALYTARSEHEGWPGLLHGGVTFSLMDEALGWAVHFQGLYGVTARIDTRFRRPIPIGMRVVIKAWTIDQRRRIATARAEVRAEVRAEAEGQALLAEADATIFLQESENQK
jgi:acyl-coenzyme A thioesterase PaaI-like protein